MGRVTVVVTVLIALACDTAQASEWVSLGKTDDVATEYLVDVSSIRVAGSIRRTLVKFVYAAGVEGGVGEYADKWVRD
jgi:hypothetical protein